MNLPGDHAALLARHDFAVPAGGDFTPAERDLLAKYGRWMEALAGGSLVPVTPAQEQFVRAARGEQTPATDHERVWVKFMRLRAEVVGRFEALARAKAEASATEAEYTARRAAVMATVRDQLAAIDDAFARRIQAATDAVAASEAAVREFVLGLGQAIHLAGVDARFYPGRVTWDAAGMEKVAAAHPEVLAYRKVGKPWVALRFTDAGHHPPGARQLPPREESHDELGEPGA